MKIKPADIVSLFLFALGIVVGTLIYGTRALFRKIFHS